MQKKKKKCRRAIGAKKMQKCALVSLTINCSSIFPYKNTRSPFLNVKFLKSARESVFLIFEGTKDISTLTNHTHLAVADIWIVSQISS